MKTLLRRALHVCPESCHLFSHHYLCMQRTWCQRQHLNTSYHIAKQGLRLHTYLESAPDGDRDSMMHAICMVELHSHLTKNPLISSYVTQNDERKPAFANEAPSLFGRSQEDGEVNFSSTAGLEPLRLVMNTIREFLPMKSMNLQAILTHSDECFVRCLLLRLEMHRSCNEID